METMEPQNSPPTQTEIQTKRPNQNKRRKKARRRPSKDIRLNSGKIGPPPSIRRRKKKKNNSIYNIFAKDNVIAKDHVVVVKKEENSMMEEVVNNLPKEETKGISCQESFLAFLKKWLDDRNISHPEVSEEAEVKLLKEETNQQED
ncbi:uncharacterized protein LOC127282946 [Leptopilina boulardi]|uniref:uncharacterized protein LOC127282946 n=1 Tax=Leptopilina boulardi TaxID=63433 RepID=UPI0021F60B47|nr:uncharacterized protein LOC127282946 [Leptopilina boulardi]